MLIPMLGMARSGFAKHASMRDALQAVHSMRSLARFPMRSFGDGEHSQRVCGGPCASTCTISPRRVPWSRAWLRKIKLPVHAGGDVCARVAGGELEAAAVPTSPTEVQAMFVGFDDDQPQMHEVCSSTRLEVHSTSMKCSCEQHRCQRHPSSEFCGSKLLLASLDPRPISHASETCCDTWETAVASLEPPPTPSASWSGQGQGQGQSHKKRRVIGTMMRKPNAQSQTIPEEPSLGELKGPFTLVRREKCQSRLAEAKILQRRRKLPHRVAGPSENLSYFLGNGTELKKCLEHCALPRRAAAHLWHSQLPKGTVCIA